MNGMGTRAATERGILLHPKKKRLSFHTPGKAECDRYGEMAGHGISEGPGGVQGKEEKVFGSSNVSNSGQNRSARSVALRACFPRGNREENASLR